MNAAAANVIAKGFLKGAFDVFDAMLSQAFSFELNAPEAMDEAASATMLESFPVVVQGRIEGDLGAFALLFRGADAVRIAAAIREEDGADRDTVDDTDKSTLTELAEPALGSGVTNLMERFGREVTPVSQVEVSDTITPAMLRGLLGESATAVPFSFNAGELISGEATVVFSGELESLVPADQLNAGDAGAPDAEAALSASEMNDILSGFDGGGGGDAGGFGSDASSSQNLDMVLDIRLVATARLGRVELPLSEVLQFGPGTIIEVGQLVDEPIELLINDKLVARGDVVVVDEKFGLRITELVSKKERIESLG